NDGGCGGHRVRTGSDHDGSGATGVLGAGVLLHRGMGPPRAGSHAPRLGDELAFSQHGRSSIWTIELGPDPSAYYHNAAMGDRRSFEELAAVPHDPDHISPASIGWNLAFF